MYKENHFACSRANQPTNQIDILHSKKREIGNDYKKQFTVF